MKDAPVVRGRTRPSKTIGQTSKRDLQIIALILEPTHIEKGLAIVICYSQPNFLSNIFWRKNNFDFEQPKIIAFL